jgi:hypothetical protein
LFHSTNIAGGFSRASRVVFALSLFGISLLAAGNDCLPFPIFKKRPDGTVWVGAVKGQDRVRQVLFNLKSSSEQAFFAWNEIQRTIVELLAN